MSGRLLFQSIVAVVLVVAGSAVLSFSLFSVVVMSHDAAILATVLLNHAIDIVLGVGLGLGIATVAEARSRARATR